MTLLAALDLRPEDAVLGFGKAGRRDAYRHEFVYFIRCLDTVKIGYSSGLSRKEQLQTGNPSQLEIIAIIPGGRQLERLLHQRFAEYNVRKEWFRLVPPIMTWLVEHITDRFQPASMAESQGNGGASCADDHPPATSAYFELDRRTKIISYAKRLGLSKDFAAEHIAAQTDVESFIALAIKRHDAAISRKKEDISIHGRFANNPLCEAIVALIESDFPEGWEGTSARLLELLRPKVSDTVARSRLWPDNNVALGIQISRLAPVLRRCGLTVEKKHSGKRWLTIRRIVEEVVDAGLVDAVLDDAP